MKVNLSKKWKFESNSALSSSDIIDFALLSTRETFGGKWLLMFMSCDLEVTNESARYIIITILFVPLLWHDGYHICLQNLLFRKLVQVRLLGASNYKKKREKRRKTKMNRVYRYILFVCFCFIQLSDNVPETVPKCTCDNTEPCFLKRSEHNTGTRTTSVVSNENDH